MVSNIMKKATIKPPSVYERGLVVKELPAQPFDKLTNLEISWVCCQGFNDNSQSVYQSVGYSVCILLKEFYPVLQ